MPAARCERLRIHWHGANSIHAAVFAHHSLIEGGSQQDGQITLLWQTVEKLAAMCNMSHSTFSMNFYRRYNMTCKEYITATRINAAENMLLFSSHDISFIAREVGYTDCSYFIRCYKKLKGITPKQARKLQLGR